MSHHFSVTLEFAFTVGAILVEHTRQKLPCQSSSQCGSIWTKISTDFPFSFMTLMMNNLFTGENLSAQR